MDFFSLLPLLILFYTVYTILTSSRNRLPKQQPPKQPPPLRGQKLPFPFPPFNLPRQTSSSEFPKNTSTEYQFEGSAGSEGIAGTEGTFGTEGTWGIEGRPDSGGSNTGEQTLTPTESKQLSTRTHYPSKVNRNTLITGVIWAEILGQPRARHKWIRK